MSPIIFFSFLFFSFLFFRKFIHRDKNKSSIFGDRYHSWTIITYGSYLATDAPCILRMCCLRWSGRQKYFPQSVHVKVYLDPSLPHSYLECRVREDRDLYARPHMTHRNFSSPEETPSIMGLAVSIHTEAFYIMGCVPSSLIHKTGACNRKIQPFLPPSPLRKSFSSSAPFPHPPAWVGVQKKNKWQYTDVFRSSSRGNDGKR